MARQPGQALPGGGAVDFERLPGALVEARTLRRGQVGVEHLLDQRVGEPVAPDGWVRHHQHALPHRLVEERAQFGRRGARHRRQHAKIDVAAEDRRG